jgi:hypothetical protein
LKSGIALTIGLSVAALVGCASTASLVIDQPIGPADRGALPRDSGTLVVYSMREFINGDQDELVHSEYSVHALDGTLVRRVNNRGLSDREPATVPLPAGRYKVLAMNYRYGRVSLTADIQAGLQTVIDLARETLPERASGEQWVRLPSGQIVGTRSE